ncbi:sorting nexin-12 [Frieseomelitta varia]|nr:sorting nexin-12 [Frieseomelitta varia]
MITGGTHENKLCQVSHRCHLTNFHCPLYRICVSPSGLEAIFLINCTVEKGMADTTVDATRRLNVKKQTLDDAYAAPANFLEIDVINPITHGVGKKRYTDYEVRMRTNLPVFKVKDSTVRRRYSDFEWLRTELERDSKIVVPPLPGKAWKRQMPFRGDDGIFEEDFIEDRRKGLEAFVNKIAGHPLAQNERCLHMFLQEPVIDKNYVPGKIRNT